jgi:hypothetical protein
MARVYYFYSGIKALDNDIKWILRHYDEKKYLTHYTNPDFLEQEGKKVMFFHISPHSSTKEFGGADGEGFAREKINKGTFYVDLLFTNLCISSRFTYLLSTG